MHLNWPHSTHLSVKIPLNFQFKNEVGKAEFKYLRKGSMIPSGKVNIYSLWRLRVNYSNNYTNW